MRLVASAPFDLAIADMAYQCCWTLRLTRDSTMDGTTLYFAVVVLRSQGGQWSQGTHSACTVTVHWVATAAPRRAVIVRLMRWETAPRRRFGEE